MDDVQRGGKHLGCRLRWDVKRTARVWSHLSLLKSNAFRSCPLGLGFMKCMERHNMDCNKLVVRAPSASASMLCIQLCLLEANRQNLTSNNYRIVQPSKTCPHVSIVPELHSLIPGIPIHSPIQRSRM